MATYYEDPTKKPKYNSVNWDETDKGEVALETYNTAKKAVTSDSPFTFSQNTWLDSIKNSIANYGDFSYDLDKDALYQQYKDKYIKLGKLAMEDTMGQAAAMTGGYGNSYAQSVGQQAYQGQLDNLNDIVPELYQMALDRYNMGKEDLYNQYSLLLSEYEREYGLHSDEYNKLLDALDIAKDDYYRGADMYNADRDNENTLASENDPEETADDYAGWTAAKWEDYFATIRNNYGKAAAKAELARMKKAGFIPTEMVLYAGIGARGSFGN